MKKKGIIFSLVVVAALLLSLMAVALPARPVSSEPDGCVLWGVTGVNFGAAGEYSEVFKVDTATGAVTIIRADASDPLYSDIAMTPDGKLYTVGRSTNDNIACPGGNPSANFDDFYRLHPATGAVIGTWDNIFTNEGFRHVNALCAESNSSLLAIEGGGICPAWNCTDAPKLLRISLDAAGNPTGIISLGVINAPGAASSCCDGDLDRDPTTGKWYAGFWAGVGSEMLELNLANPGSSTVVSQSNILWQGGFAFCPNPTAYAGCWADRNLYTVDVIGGGSAVAYDLSSELGGNIFGLSLVHPPPVGGEVYPISAVGTETGVSPLWVGLGVVLILAAGGGVLVLRHRRAHQSIM